MVNKWITLEEIKSILGKNVIYIIGNIKYYEDELGEIIQNPNRWLVTYIEADDDYILLVTLEEIK